MPKLGGMAQLSRPFQVALLALAVLVLAWFAVLHRPGGSPTGSAPSAHSSAGATAAKSSPNGDPSHVYHGPVPGLEGLTRDIKRAHEASTTSQNSNQAIQSKAAQASNEAGSAATSGGTSVADRAARADHSHVAHHAGAVTGTSAAATAGSRTQTHAAHDHTATTVSKSAPAATHRAPRAQHGSAAAAPSKSPPREMQAVVASELKQGKIVLLLFWNPHSSDDDATAIETAIAAHRLGHSVAVHFARANQVNSFGSITREIQIYQTPTLLIINPKLEVTTLTGLADAYTIEQAVAEARG
jgi:hypothetical protein